MWDTYVYLTYTWSKFILYNNWSIAMELTGINIKEYLANTPQITFEVTEKCNLSCVYCGYGKLYLNKGERHDRSLTIKKALLFLEYLRNLWDEGLLTSIDHVLNISFYGGEPLMNFQLIQAVIGYIETKLSSYPVSFVYSMTTNAILITKYIDYIVSKKFRLLISIDGDEKGSSLRQYKNGKPAFNDIVSSINLIRSRYPKYFESKVEFNSVLNSRTSVEEIIKYIQNEYHKVPSISEINTDGVNQDMISEFNSIYLDKWNSMMEMYKKGSNSDNFLDNPHFERVARYILGHSPYVYHSYNELLYDSQSNRKILPTGTCLPFTKRVFITVTGSIMPCEKIGYNYSLGTVTDEIVSLDYNEIAKKYNSYYQIANKRCKYCKEKNACLTCIFYSGLLDNHQQPKCKYFVTKENLNATRMEVYDFLSRYPNAYHYIMTQFEIH